MPQEYSYNDLVKMQEQAIRRVRDMQERARLTMQEHNDAQQMQRPESYEQPASSYDEQTEETKENHHSQQPENGGQSRVQATLKPPAPKQQNPFGNLLNLDKDKAMILPLLLLLGKESSDNILLLALMYIMA